jgi:fumarate reductase subunit C
MKDIVIKSGTVKKELSVFLVCFIFAFLVNVFAINQAGTLWRELFTQLGYVIVIALIVYLLLALLRGVVRLVMMPFSRRKRR